MNLLPEVSTLPSLVGISPVKVEIQFFYKLPRDLTLVTWSKNFVALRVGASHSKSAPSLVWCPWIFYKWKLIYFIYHVVSQDHLIEGSFESIGGGSL